MAGPPTGLFGELSFIFSGLNAPTGAVSTLGIESPVVDFFNVTWQNELVGLSTDLVQLTCNDATTLERIDIKVGPVSSGPTIALPVSEPGAQTGNTVGPQVAMLVRKEVENVSTRLAGRMFWPGLTVGNVSPGGVIAPEAIEDFQDAWTDFYNGLVALTSAPYIFTESSDPRVVSALTVQAKVATQRRRNRR